MNNEKHSPIEPEINLQSDSKEMWRATEPDTPLQDEKEFQFRVNDWMQVCFGEEISSDVQERNHRFIEEALELVQATGATKSECMQLVDYVFSRDIGEINQEIGGVMVTLAAMSNAMGLNMNKAGETELQRIWLKVEKIRAKQAAKPKHSPLPSLYPTPLQQVKDNRELARKIYQALKDKGAGIGNTSIPIIEKVLDSEPSTTLNNEAEIEIKNHGIPSIDVPDCRRGRKAVYKR